VANTPVGPGVAVARAAEPEGLAPASAAAAPEVPLPEAMALDGLPPPRLTDGASKPRRTSSRRNSVDTTKYFEGIAHAPSRPGLDRPGMLREVDLLRALGDPEIEAAVQELEEMTFKAGEVIYSQDDAGESSWRANSCFFVESGLCYATHKMFTLPADTRVKHKSRGVGTVVEVTEDPSITRVQFDVYGPEDLNAGEHKYTPASLHKLKPVAAVEPIIKEIGQYGPGNHFGERVLTRVSRVGEPRPLTITCRTDVTVLRLSAETFLKLKRQQDHKDSLLRCVSFFETFSDDQIAKLASVLQEREFAKDETLIRQGEEGHHFYILDVGECVCTVESGSDKQEVKRYQHGGLFGEKALLDSSKRAATITAVDDGVKAWMVSRDDFEKALGRLDIITHEQYLTDPRHLIAAFYRKGDAHGPAGSLAAPGKTSEAPTAPGAQTSWFAVYRPCSRDSIAKMLGRVGTGKGLNIKGKSAKKNRLSGFVPFVQISENEDKKALEVSPSSARTRIFYQSAEDCATARKKLENTLKEMQAEKESKLQIDEQEVRPISKYAKTGAHGLDVPELLMREVYIKNSDISPAVGWETGRDSEPAFLDMNLHSLRGGGSPSVVLYQYDKCDPMNPLGLLMAYAETHKAPGAHDEVHQVKPVVSDFDTLLVGSRGMRYEPTPPDQVTLMNWALDKTTQLLAHPESKGWMGRWLNVLKEEAAQARNGFHPVPPQYGYGDPTSYGLIREIVHATADCGAVRHGAECFNFYFPQELDAEFLIVWDGLDSPPWKTVKEPELRAFLLERAKEGYSFPLNPVWPVRDVGWLEVLHALQAHEEAAHNLNSWFPPESGVLKRIAEIHAEYPDGFIVANEDEMRRTVNKRASVYRNITDCDPCEMADIYTNEVGRETKARWQRIRGAVKMHMLSFRTSSEFIEAD